MAYVPGISKDESVTAYWNGGYYTFTVDDYYVYGDMDTLAGEIENITNPKVIMPVGDYGAFDIKFAADFYGANYMVDPVDKADKATPAKRGISALTGVLSAKPCSVPLMLQRVSRAR